MSEFGQYHRLVRRSIIPLLIIVGIYGAGWLYVFVYNKIIFEDLDRRYGPINGWSDAMKEAYFKQKFPTYDEIENYLSDSTILHSEQPIGNDVIYTDGAHNYIRWTSNGFSTGTWAAWSRWGVFKLGSRWRFVTIYLFCHYDPDEGEQVDNCYIVSNLNSIYGYYSDGREYRKGNVFDLSISKGPPFRLPINTPITIDKLLAAMKSR